MVLEDTIMDDDGGDSSFNGDSVDGLSIATFPMLPVEVFNEESSLVKSPYQPIHGRSDRVEETVEYSSVPLNVVVATVSSDAVLEQQDETEEISDHEMDHHDSMDSMRHDPTNVVEVPPDAHRGILHHHDHHHVLPQGPMIPHPPNVDLLQMQVLPPPPLPPPQPTPQHQYEAPSVVENRVWEDEDPTPQHLDVHGYHDFPITSTVNNDMIANLDAFDLFGAL
jgi:hypothetical protein